MEIHPPEALCAPGAGAHGAAAAPELTASELGWRKRPAAGSWARAGGRGPAPPIISLLIIPRDRFSGPSPALPPRRPPSPGPHPPALMAAAAPELTERAAAGGDLRVVAGGGGVEPAAVRLPGTQHPKTLTSKLSQRGIARNGIVRNWAGAHLVYGGENKRRERFRRGKTDGEPGAHLRSPETPHLS